MREAFENLKSQVGVEEKLKMEPKSRRMMIEEEETSQQRWVNEVVDTKAQVWYDNAKRLQFDLLYIKRLQYEL